MQQLKFINSRGAEVDFDLGAPYIFWKVEGLEFPGVETVASQAAGQNGYTLHEILLEPRTVRIFGHVHGRGNDGVKAMYEARKKLNAVCNPLFGVGKLVYQNDFGTWWIPAFCGSEAYTVKIKEISTIVMNFECPSPFWLSDEATEIALAYVEGGLEFPLKTPGFFGSLGYRAVIDNDGDADIPLEITLGGGSVNPTITNKTTGEYICVERELLKDDKLYINTDPEKLEVSLIRVDPETNQEVKTNAYGHLSVGSSLLRIPAGVNDLIFHTDDENKRVKIRIRYYKRYVGV